MKRLRRAALVALLLLVGAGRVPVVGATDQWCDVDPALLVTTPAGKQVVVYLTNGALGLEHQAAVQTASVTYTVRSVAGRTATLVRVEVTVPDDAFGSAFPTRTKASSGPQATGTVYASTSGVSGQPMRLDFTLDVP